MEIFQVKSDAFHTNRSARQLAYVHLWASGLMWAQLF